MKAAKEKDYNLLYYFLSPPSYVMQQDVHMYTMEFVSNIRNIFSLIISSI